MSKYETEIEACRAWVDRFNNIPGALITRAFSNKDGASEELELLAGGKLVSDCCDVSVTDCDTSYKCDECGQKCDTHTEGSDNWPAMWGTLWTFGEAIDEVWARTHADEIGALGFLVYSSDETGILLAIDGAGFDFYEAFWVPLYRLRGLEWHLTEEQQRQACIDKELRQVLNVYMKLGEFDGSTKSAHRCLALSEYEVNRKDVQESLTRILTAMGKTTV